MRLLRLRLVNFRQHRDTAIEFGDGLTGLIGPNGAGKTTLLEAIAWALYGTAAARGTRDSLRWNRATPRSEVRAELDFALGPHEYRVVRTLFNAELYLDRGPRPITTSLAEVTTKLTRILRMGYDEFFRTYFTGQKDLAAMASLRPTERRHFLNRLLGYDRLRAAQELVRQRRSAMNSELSGLQQGGPDPRALAAARIERGAEHGEMTRRLEAAVEAQAAARGASDQHLPVFRELKEFRERHASLSADRRVVEAELRQTVEAVARLADQHRAAAAAGAELTSLAPRLAAWQAERAALAELEALQRDADTRARIDTQVAEVGRQTDEVGARLAASAAKAERTLVLAEQLEAQRTAGDAAAGAWTEAQAAWEREKADAAATRRSLLDQYADLESQRERVVAAGEGGACPTCGRPLGREYANVLELLDSQLEGIRQNGLYFKSRLEQLRSAPAELVELDARRHALAAEVEGLAQELALARRAADEAMELEKQMRQLADRRADLHAQSLRLKGGYDRARHDQVLQAVAELEPAARRAERLAADAERVTGLAAELEAAEARRGTLVERFAGIERELAALAFNEDAFLSAEREMVRLEEAWRAAERAVVQAQAEERAALERLRAAERQEQEAAARAARQAELQMDVRLHTELDRALGELGSDLNAEIGPEIAAIASDLLSGLTDGQYDEIQLDDEFEATVLEDGQPQTVLSGGEEDLVNLVLRLAVSQMIADRAGQPLSLLVLDEIFGSLDDTHRDGVMRLLRGLGGRFPQVVLISHVEGVRESLDRVLRVRYDEASGASVVSDERPRDPGTGAPGADVAA